MRNNLVLGLGEVAARLPLVMTIGYLARGLGPGVYGNWTLVLVLQTLVISLAGLGLSSSISRIASTADGDTARSYLDLTLGSSLFALAVLAAVILPLGGPITRALGVTVAPMTMVSLALLLSAAGILEGVMDAYFKARTRIGRQLGFLCARTAAEVVAIWSVFVAAPAGGAADPVGSLTRYVLLVTSMKLVAYALLLGRGRGAVPLDGKRRLDFLRYGLPMVPAALVLWVVSQGYRAVLGHTVTKADLGIFGFAATVAAYVHYLGYAIYPLLLPYASRSYDAGRVGEVNDLLRTSQWVALGLLFPCLVSIALFAPEVVLLTAGPSYMAAAGYMPVLAFAFGLEVVLGVYQYVFHLARRPVVILPLSVLNGVLVLVAAYAGGRAGVARVPAAILVSAVIYNVVRYLAARRFMKLPGLSLAAMLAVSLAVVVVLTRAQHWHFGVRLLAAAALAAPAVAWSAVKLRSLTGEAAGDAP